MSVAVVMELEKFTALYDSLVQQGKDLVTNAIIYIIILFCGLLALGLL